MNEGHTPRLEELLLHWQELREQSRSVTPEELCRDCPELAEPLRKLIDLMAGRHHLADEVGRPAVSSAPQEQDVTTIGLRGGESCSEISAPPAGTAADLPAQVGRYRVEEEIARGGMGRVVRVRDDDFQRPLAMKLLLARTPELEERFLREAQMTGRLQHPGIPPVHELGRLPDGGPYFLMKLIQGRSLQALLRQRTAPAEELPRFVAIFEHVCQTVGYAHSRGVIHRDLKPANVMVGAFGEV